MIKMPISRTALDGLRRDFKGEIILPESAGYSEARTIFNAMIDRRPAVIAQCTDAEDVVREIDPPGYRNYWSAEYLDAFPDDAVEAFCGCAEVMVVPASSQHAFFPHGGAL